MKKRLTGRSTTVFGMVMMTLLLSPALVVAHADVFNSGESRVAALDSPDRIPGRYIAVLKKEVVEQMLRSGEVAGPDAAVRAIGKELSDRHGGRIDRHYAHALQGFAIQADSESVAESLTKDWRVAFVEADQEIRLSATQSPAPWGLDRIDQRNLPLNNSFTYSNTGSNVHAYIIDSGIRATHNEFGTRVKTGYTAIGDGNGTNDCNGHGTHVAGTVGGTTYGVAKGVSLYPVRVFPCVGGSLISTIVAGVDWVTANRQLPAVANMSLGGSASATLDMAVSGMIGAGVTTVVAAGNDYFDACYISPARMSASSAVITVGNSTQTDGRNPLSNWGTCLTLFAPGTNIISAGHSNNTATAVLSGTSMAAPHVAGAAALYLNSGHQTPSAVKNAIVYSASSGKITNTASSPNLLLYLDFSQPGGGAPPLSPAPSATPYLDAFCVGGGNYFFNFGSAGDIGAYEFYVSSNSGFSPQYLGGYLPSDPGWVMYTLFSAEHYRVRACNGAGCGPYSPGLFIVPYQLCP